MTGRTPDELPVRAIVEITNAAGEVMDEKLDEHVQEYHLPKRPTGPVQAVPDPDYEIPDVDAAAMVSMMSKGFSMAEAANTYGHPLPVVQRVLQAYKARYGAFCESWGAPLGSGFGLE